MAENNNRKTWKDVWERMARVETKLDMVLGNVTQIPKMCEEIDVLQKASNKNSIEHKTFWNTFVHKNSFKIVSIIVSILMFVVAIIEIIRVI